MQNPSKQALSPRRGKIRPASTPKSPKAGLSENAQACFFLILTAALYLFSGHLADRIRTALSVCAFSLIPSVFPFMVMTAVLCDGKAGRWIARALHPLLQLLFGVSDAGAFVVAMGWMGGFPSGALCAVRLYEKGALDAAELSRLLCFVNNPSPAFVIRALGGALFSSLPLGRRIYFCVVLSSAMAGLLSRFLFPLFSPSTAPEALTQSSKKTALASARSPLSASAPASSVFVNLSGALTRSAGAMLNVCASVVFFSAFGECLLTMGRQIMAWRPFRQPEWITVLVSGFIEISGGCASAALLSDRELGALCACVICSFSGMAVFMQICTTCQAVPGVSFRPYWVSKIFQACLSPSLLILWLRLQPLEIPPVVALPTGSGFLPSPERIFAIAISAFFCLCLLFTHRAKTSP